MALTRITIDGYGQLELNAFAARSVGSGKIEAQCPLSATDFATAYAENGMLLAVDNIAREVKFATDATYPIGLNYTAEHQYDERLQGLKNFKLERGTVYPRIGYLTVGDKFTTNTLSYDATQDTSWTTDDLVKAALAKTALASTKVYGGISANGSIYISATKPTTGPVLLALGATTMPDGQFGLKLQVVSC